VGHVDGFLRDVAATAEGLPRDRLEALAEGLAELRERGGRLFVVGVGGGAANASHAVADFRRLCGIDALCPVDNVASLTAGINDESWEEWYATWLRDHDVAARDALMVLSVGGGSPEHGLSPNIARAVSEAASAGAPVYGIVGRDDGVTARLGDVVVIVPAPPESLTPLTESFQSVICHMLATHPRLAVRPATWEARSGSA
jgi:D-sedoheptulose 7-phosphate isomerase